MGSISTVDARPLLTKALADVYKERISPLGFLRSFFMNKEFTTRFISIQVQRGSEKVAVDVERGTEGNRNTLSKSTEKIFDPPYYSEYLDATELHLYDILFGSKSIDSGAFAQFVEELSDGMHMLQDKIERAYELQCAQVIETGIVQLEAGINIDFKRKAASLVDGSATPWTDDANNPMDQIKAGCEFLRKTGKAQGTVFNIIMGSSAKAAFDGNQNVIDTANLRRVDNLNIRMPQRNSVGGTTHGEFSAGDYVIRLWTYPEFYENSSGTVTPYINSKKIIILPEAPRFSLSFAAVPQLLTEGQQPRKGAFIISDYKDERRKKHDFVIESAGVAVPVAVDQIYTRQVVA